MFVIYFSFTYTDNFFHSLFSVLYIFRKSRTYEVDSTMFNPNLRQFNTTQQLNLHPPSSNNFVVVTVQCSGLCTVLVFSLPRRRLQEKEPPQCAFLYCPPHCYLLQRVPWQSTVDTTPRLKQ